jgi:DNA-binding transcriptional MerR regulator
MNEKLLFIGKVAKQTGINPKTIRYYEEINLLPKSKRERNNYRLYSKDTIKRLLFIKKAQSLGFTLKEIKEILILRDRGFKPCAHVRDLLRQRVIDLEQKLAELTTLRRELKKLEDEWTSIKTVEDDKGEGICPQIERVIVRLTKKPSKALYPKKSTSRLFL